MKTTTTRPESDLFCVGEAEVRAQLALIEKRRADSTSGFDRDVAMATAALARAHVGFMTERRQNTTQAERAIADIPVDESSRS